MLQRTRFTPLAFVLLAAFTAAGCAAPGPDLERLYRFDTASATQPPVILIHGFMGSKLRDSITGETLWPPGRHADRRRLALAIDSATDMPQPSAAEAYALLGDEKNLALDPSIFRVLEQAGGYTLAQAGQPAADGQRHYYVFLYDWRQDHARSAAQLAAFIEQVRKDYADPALQVDLVAHGTGGLVARWYLRYGAADVQESNEFLPTMAGRAAVRRVILLGTPNLGTITSVTAAIYGLNERGQPGGQLTVLPEVLATMPALYQRFPHPVQGWLTNLNGEILEIDVYEASLWQTFKWSVFNARVEERVTRQQGAAQLAILQHYFKRQIERARRFAWALSVPPRGDTIDYIVFGGACIPTPTKLLVETVNGRDVLRLFPEDISAPLDDVDYERLMLEPGDGTTPKSSLLARQALDPRVRRHKHLHFPIDYAMFLCEGHGRLTGNLYFHDNLLHALLSADET